MKGCLYLLVLQCVISTAFSQVRLPRLISDGMVLQQNVTLKIWGWASPNERISINFIEKNYSAITSSDGKWFVTLPPISAGGPYVMTIEGHNHIVIKNILIGEVWLCSGQSNMELPVDRVVAKYPNIISQTNNTNIRQFAITTAFNFEGPKDDVATGSWLEANPNNIGQFSAVGYFFAKQLYQQYKVPIGLIRSAVGGSPAEAWLSSDALKLFPTYDAVAEKFSHQSYVDSIRNSDNAVNAAWYSNLWQQDKGIHESKKWFENDYVSTDWKPFQLPGYWDTQGLKNTNGVVWFRKEITVPPQMSTMPLTLRFGNVVDRDSIYINSVFVGSVGYQYPPRKYLIPAGVIKAGKNTITIKVINSNGRGGFYMDKPYWLASAKDTIDVTGQWQYKLAVAVPPLPATTTLHYMPGGLYNAMIAPLLNYSIKGVIWYQGESNTGRAQEYKNLFSAVINSWRQHWDKGDFPFLYVQLANYMDAKKEPGESQWAALREAQLQTLQLHNTAMAVTIDVGESNDIHPLNKDAVGSRLAIAAQAKAYGDKKNVFSGPLYQSMKVKKGKIVLKFSNTGSGLVTTNNELKYFSIAGVDMKFVWAKATIQGKKVIVWNDKIINPVAVRYAWADNPEGANLFNKEGLPASPFRTDTK